MCAYLWQEIAHDLLSHCAAVGEGRAAAPSLLGDVVIEPVLPDGAYEVLLHVHACARARAHALARWRAPSCLSLSPFSRSLAHSPRSLSILSLARSLS